MSTYRDFKINLDPHPVKKDIVFDTDERAIEREIKNILLVGKGELPYDKLDFGSGLAKYLFENVSPVYEKIISDEIIRQVENYSTRAIVLDAIVKVLDEENGYSATIIYRPINSSQRIELNIILNRIR